MIGVFAREDDLPTVREFFELFKIPWEPVRAGAAYSAVVVAAECDPLPPASVVIVYGNQEQPVDRRARVSAARIGGPVSVSWREARFPVYGPVAAFDRPRDGAAAQCNGKPIEYRLRNGDGTVVRVGVDLFQEVRRLLTDGQPAEEALTPTLEWHIALLRSMLIETGVDLREIPPRPYGYDFVCCLTHDIDFHGIRRHAIDHTLVGFVYRASLGSLLDVVKGRRPLGYAIRNWVAVASLPLVFLRVVRDFWRPLDDYPAVEGSDHSTFFIVPFKDRPGAGRDGGVAPAMRAVRYGASEVSREVRAAAGRGSEIAVHGIDAWRDAEAGRAELTEVSSAAGLRAAGVRMHWLYFGQESPQRLEAAGFAYDSSCGYNETIGYRAGTSQVFRPLTAERLMELPLTIMDTALLFPGRMNLIPAAALNLCSAILANAKRFGGTVVVNWHDRSLAPERLWGDCYRGLLSALTTTSRPWFTTTGRAVDWFRWRRSIRFSRIGSTTDVAIAADVRPADIPPAVVVRYVCAAAEEQPFDGAWMLDPITS